MSGPCGLGEVSDKHGGPGVGGDSVTDGRGLSPQLAWSGCIYNSGGDSTDGCGPGASRGRDSALRGFVQETDLEEALSWLVQGVPGLGSWLMEPVNTTWLPCVSHWTRQRAGCHRACSRGLDVGHPGSCVGGGYTPVKESKLTPICTVAMYI